jgi:23S rRNA (uracil1939-C5)-methyltransferase
VFVRRALSGETVEARILKVSSGAVFAKTERVLEASPERLAPACPHFGRCGGCDFLHMTYAEELRSKRRRVSDALRRIGGVDIAVPEAAPSPATEGYRNKAIFEAGRSADGRAATGFYRERSHELIALETCLIQSSASLRAAAAVREWMDGCNIPAELVRYVFFREGHGAQIAVVTSNTGLSRTGLPHRETLIALLRERIPETAGILQIVNGSAGNVALDGDIRLLYGSEYLEDELGGLTFRLSPRSFYQVNRAQAEGLYAEVLRLAALTENDTALDLYCGAGTITLALAKSAGRVYGAEIVPEAVMNARENAALNGVTNAEFRLGDAGSAAEALARSGVFPDVITVDPPRKGLAPGVIDAIARLRPRRVVYVSCDPATLARDARLFAGRGYLASEVSVFDMFPRCAHVETVLLLTAEEAQ